MTSESSPQASSDRCPAKQPPNLCKSSVRATLNQPAINLCSLCCNSTGCTTSKYFEETTAASCYGKSKANNTNGSFTFRNSARAFYCCCTKGKCKERKAVNTDSGFFLSSFLNLLLHNVFHFLHPAKIISLDKTVKSLSFLLMIN